MAKSRPRQGSPLRLSGAFELFGKSYDIIRRHFEVFMVLFSVAALLALWDTLGRYVDDEQTTDWKQDFLLQRTFGPNTETGVFAAGGLMFIVSILYVVAYLLILIAVLRASQGQPISLRGLWREFVDRWLWLKLIGTFILLVLAFIVGFLALIIPGIILLWRLFFVPYIVIDQRTKITDAFRQSWRMTRGYAWPVYSVLLVSILLSFTSVVPIFGPLIAFALTSIYTVAPALRYQEVKNLQNNQV